MRLTIKNALTGALLLIVAAACGGSAAPSGSGTASPSSAASTAPAASSTAPAATSTAPSQGGTDVQDPCALATVEEVSSALGVEVVAEAVTGDTTTYCNYNAADGSPVMATSFSRGNTFVYDSYASGEGAVLIPGIGDGAVVTSQGVLFIKSGDALVGLQPADEFDSPQELISALTPLAQAVASRL